MKMRIYKFRGEWFCFVPDVGITRWNSFDDALIHAKIRQISLSGARLDLFFQKGSPSLDRTWARLKM